MEREFFPRNLLNTNTSQSNLDSVLSLIQETSVTADAVTIDENAQGQLRVKPGSIGNAQLNQTSNFALSGNITYTGGQSSNDSLVNRAYVDSQVAAVVAGEIPAVSAGDNIELDGNEINVRVDNVGIERDSAQNRLRLRDGGVTSEKLSNGQFIFQNTTATSSPTSGAVQIRGGLGVSQNLYVGGERLSLIAEEPRILIGGDGGVGNSVGLEMSPWVGRPGNAPIRFTAVDDGQASAFLNLECAGPGATSERAQVMTVNRFHTMFRQEEESVSKNTGAVRIMGGLGVTKDVRCTTLFADAATILGALNVSAPTQDSHAASKLYVDTFGSGVAGTGLTKTGNTFSVNAALPNVTSLGTLAGLAVSGTSALTNLTISGTASAQVPTLATQIATKGYVDNLSYLTFSAPLARSGANVTISSTPTFATTTLTSATASTSSTTGALVVAGGAGIAGALNLGGNLDLSSASPRISLRGGGTAGNVVSLDLNPWSGRAGGTSCRVSAIDNGAQSSFLSIALSSDDNTSAPQETLSVRRNQTRVQSTTVSTSKTSGALRVDGGLGVAGSVFCGPLTADSANFLAPASGVMPTLDSHLVTRGWVLAQSYLSTSAADLTANTLSLTSSANTTNSLTGALRVAGGAYVGGNVLCEGSRITLSDASPELLVVGAGGAGNQVKLSLMPWSGRSGGVPTEIAGVDNGSGSAHISLNVAAPSSSAAPVERVRVRSDELTVFYDKEATSLTDAALTCRGGLSVSRQLRTGGTATLQNVRIRDGSLINRIQSFRFLVGPQTSNNVWITVPFPRRLIQTNTISINCYYAKNSTDVDHVFATTITEQTQDDMRVAISRIYVATVFPINGWLSDLFLDVQILETESST
jgi:hypothetical protein